MDSEQFHDHFEVEVSDLDEPENSANSSQLSQLFRKPRFSSRQRRLYLILLNGLLILAVVLPLATMNSVRDLASSLFNHPLLGPTATLAPGVDLYYVRASPPWGRLIIDGHVTALPIISTNPPLRLARGQHQLVWQAYPFLAQRCTVSVPPNVEDSCRDHDTAQAGLGLTAWVITFSESLANLAGTPRASLLKAVQSALDVRQSTDTVLPGERYVLAPDEPACSRKEVHGNQCYATSSQPLRATLSFQLDTNQNSNETCIDFQPGNCTLDYQDCRLFCDISFSTSSSTREWDVFVPVLMLWTFVTMDGRVLARNVPDDSAWDYATSQTLDESLVQLHITWENTRLQFAASVDMDNQGSGYFDPACAALTQQVSSLNPPADANGPLYLQWQFTSGTLPAAGCLAVGTPQPEDGLTAPTQQPAMQQAFYYLHRFGVLLAVNNQAQSTGLLLPLANVYEQQLARMLIEGSSGQQSGSISKKSLYTFFHGAVR
jgi:hypothetical protein